jgi:hypothetical protein
VSAPEPHPSVPRPAAVGDDPAPAPRLRLLPPPVWAATAPPSIDQVRGQQPLDLEFCLPNGLSAVPTVREHPPATDRHASGLSPWVARLAQAVLEVEAAERPVMQLSRWVVPDIYRRLDRRQQLRARQLDPRVPRTRCPEHVRSVHVCHPAPDVAEVSVVTTGAERCRALALRLERRKGRWMCTALDWA